MSGMNQTDSPTVSGQPSTRRAPDPEALSTLAREKGRISGILSLLTLGFYFGFAILLAWSPQTLASRVGNATLGIPLGMSVIVISWILTGVYVRWANSRHDELVALIRSQIAPDS
jgi:uncharacterized membrane protein (DUF485 family)